jgi:hypothetical protein
MKQCLINGKPTEELNGLCPECGKIWIDSVNRKFSVTLSCTQRSDDLDAIIELYDAKSSLFPDALNQLIAKVNILECFNSYHTLLLAKSKDAYDFIVMVLTSVLEHHPFPRVMLVRLIDYPNTAKVIFKASSLIRKQLIEYKEETKKELTKSITKKQSAEKLKRKQARLRVEFIIFNILSAIAVLGGLFLFIQERFSILVLIGLVAALMLLLLILKFTRYSSLDMNLKTNPYLNYQIDLMDIPDSYLSNLKIQVKKLEDLE